MLNPFTMTEITVQAALNQQNFPYSKYLTNFIFTSENNKIVNKTKKWTLNFVEV